MKKRKAWTDADREQLKALYPSTSTQTIALAMGRTDRAIYQQALTMGLKKDAEYMAGPHSGRLDGIKGGKTRFKKGQTPWNKGMKGLQIGGAETRFRAGHVSGRAAELLQPIGAERATKDGIRQRKIRMDGPAQRRWKAVHAILWEEHNGKIPDGSIVVFRDGNKQNIVIENLELITRAENMKRNSYHNYPKEIAQLIQLRGAVNRQINKRANQ